MSLTELARRAGIACVAAEDAGGLTGVDLILEAGPERLDAKRAAVAQLAGANQTAPIATVTGLCAVGAHRLVAEGATKLGGRIPVSTDGGLIGRGHPGGPTGLAQIWETTL
jgi:acetyl-CoA acetyltransferase